MVFNLQMQVQLLLLQVEQAGHPGGAGADTSQADAVLGVAAMGVMFSATQAVQLLYRSVLRLLGSPEQVRGWAQRRRAARRMAACRQGLLHGARTLPPSARPAPLCPMPQQAATTEAAFAQSAAWGASVEAVLVAHGVVLNSIATGTRHKRCVARSILDGAAPTAPAKAPTRPPPRIWLLPTPPPLQRRRGGGGACGRGRGRRRL